MNEFVARAKYFEAWNNWIYGLNIGMFFHQKRKIILHFPLILFLLKEIHYLLLSWVDEDSPIVSRRRMKPAKPWSRQPKQCTISYLSAIRKPRWYHRLISVIKHNNESIVIGEKRVMQNKI